jgi:aryl-alcohol dehydrogenase-like predicted oxidoreductase
MRILEESLRRLQTDHLDLWQIHEVIYENDPDLIFAPDGAAEALLEAKQQTKFGSSASPGTRSRRFTWKIDSMELLNQNLAGAANFQPFSAAEMTEDLPL